ncbi:MAG: hypothetical protein AB2401_10720, partial [Bacillus sp. (in: firmicutes)]
ITYGILIVLSVGGVITYVNNGEPAKKATNSAAATSQKATVDNLLKTMNNGTTKTAPIESVILSKFYYGDKKENGAAAILPDRPRIDEAQFISASEKFITAEELQLATSLIGKTKPEVEAIDASMLKHIEVVYNSKNVVEGVTLDIISSGSKQIKEFAGKPVFHLEDKAYLYHGQKYDYILYTTDDKLFNKMTILPVLDPVQTVEDTTVSQEQPEENDSQVVKKKKNNDADKQKKNKTNSDSSSQKSSGKTNTPTPNPTPAPTTPGNNKPDPKPVTPPEDPKPEPPPVTPGDDTPTPEPPPDDTKPPEQPAEPVETPEQK